MRSKAEELATVETVTPPPAQAVIEWLVAGASEQQIVEALKAKYPDVDANNTLTTVADRLAKAGRPDVDAVRGWALMSYRKLYQSMMQVGDYDGCRKVVKEIVSLCG